MKLIKILPVVGFCVLANNAMASSETSGIIETVETEVKALGDPKTVVVKPHRRSLPRRKF